MALLAALVLVLMISLSHSLARAEPVCALPQPEPVRIVSCQPDPVLADGRVVLRAGIMAKLLLPCPVGPAQLSVLSKKPDRWGRLQGVLWVGAPSDAIPPWEMSEVLMRLREGYGLARPQGLPPGCWPIALAAEQAARAARLGLWAGQQSPIIPAHAIDALRAAEGRFVIVEGIVVSVRRGRNRVFLNLGAFGGDRFSVTVSPRLAAQFDAKGLALNTLRGQAVSVRGVVGPGPSMELSILEALAIQDRR